MRFLADMGISLKTVQYLKRRGHDIVHLRDERLQRLSDDKIVIKAEKEKRIILTCDLDFGTIMAFSGDTFPSIIIFRLSDFSAFQWFCRKFFRVSPMVYIREKV